MKTLLSVTFIIYSFSLLSCKKEDTATPSAVELSDTSTVTSKLIRWDQLPEQYRKAKKIIMSGDKDVTTRVMGYWYGPYGSNNYGVFYYLNFYQEPIVGIGIGTLDGGSSVSVLMLWCKKANGEVVLYASSHPQGSSLVFRGTDSDEYIRGVAGNASTNVNRLMIYTNKTVLTMGTGVGASFRDLPGPGIEFRVFSGYYGVNKISTIRYLSKFRPWTQIAGSSGKDIAVDGSGNSYMVNSVGNIYRMNANASVWTQLAGSDAVSIAVNAGKVCMVNKVGKIYRLSGDNSWQEMPGSDAQDITIDANGTIWMINRKGYIYTFEGTSWIRKPGSSARRIAAGGVYGQTSEVWMVNNAGDIYKWSNLTWNRMPGSDGADIAIGNDYNVWLTNTAGIIYCYDERRNHWTLLAGSDGATIAANSNKALMVNTAGKIFKMTY